jgi:acyl-CoA thioesterase II
VSAEIKSAWPDHPEYRIDLVPCAGTARVRVGDLVLAESTSALRLIETAHVERLYFPERDVRTDLLEPNDHTTVCPFKGRASYWARPGRRSPADDLFWTYREPFAEVAGIGGHLGIYHERAEVEVESVWPDGSTSVNRFPIWGDQADLVGLLDAQPAGPGRFVAPGYHERSRNVVEGGQLLGQAIVAAARSAPEQRVTWASMTFARAADFDDPVELTVDPLRRGRTFSTFEVRSQQRGKLVAPALVLLDSGAPDAMRAVAGMPDVPGPEEAEPYDMRVAGRDLRIVDGAYSPDPDRVGPPQIHAWMRFLENPPELYLRNALVAQATTHWTIAAGMLPHRGMGEAEAHVSLSTGPVAISLSFHDDIPLDQWLLYSTTATWSGQGLVQGEGLVFSRSGALMASYSLQAMVRGMLSSAGGRDATTAM